MALEVVGGAFLSASLQALFREIPSVVDFLRRHRVEEGLLNKLKIRLWVANGVLDDADIQQLTKPEVGEWLEQLQDAAHDAEDLVDEINSEALRCKIEGELKADLRHWLRSSMSSWFTENDVRHKTKNIIHSLDDILLYKEYVNLEKGKGVHTATPFQIQRSSLNVLVNESKVYGREAEKEAITRFLLSDGDGGNKVSVMPIVGMGGVGKTTLAQLAYNTIDGEAVVMERPFVIKAWITVSDESKCDVFTLTKTIYEKVTKKTVDNTIKEALFELQLKLREALEGKKFFFVLDDVWSLDYQIWNELQTLFQSAANGSKIIVTTRLPYIAKDLVTADSEMLDLQLLSEADCWQLFSKLAFNNVEPSSYPDDLVEIGRKIIERCKGNPLAVKSLACLLHSELNPKKWEEVLGNDLWELTSLREHDILSALWLSYYYLPRYLKPCFAFCSIFPKDFRFKKEKLILLWMAEGFLQPQSNIDLEDVGEKYFEELTSRSFFDVDEDNYFTMHDLVNDLAKFVSRKSCLRLDDNTSVDLVKKARHISFMSFMTLGICDKLEGLFENKVLRSVLKFQGRATNNSQIIKNFKHLGSMQSLRVVHLDGSFLNLTGFSLELVSRLKLLRYLDLSSNSGIHEIPDTICTLYNLQTLLLSCCENLVKLPDSIRKLRRLRYLDLYGTGIGEIPDTICNLQELRALVLPGSESCHFLPTEVTHLPAKITRLTNLRQLDLSETSLEEMPRGMSNLKNLQILRKFVVGINSGSGGLEELGNLQHLRGDLTITGLENVVEVEGVSSANMKNKPHIAHLKLEWNHEYDNDIGNKALEVLDGLQPHTNVKHLNILNYGGTSFPGWLSYHSFCRLKSLWLKGCKQCRQLPPLGGLPSLEELEISEFYMLETIDNEFYDAASSSSSSSPFKSLKELTFRCMPKWKEWSSFVGGAFSNLEVLALWECPKLEGACLPDHLPSLKRLYIGFSSHHLVNSLAKFPSLRGLTIEDCLGMKSFPSGRLPESIQTIEISGCRELESLSEEVGWACSSLKSIEIEECDKLFAHSSTKWNLGMLTSLTCLSIGAMDMGGVGSFPEEEGQLPTTLTSLGLGHLKNLKSLNGMAFRHLTALQTLSIRYCKQLQCLPEGLPASLSELKISGCPELTPRCQRGTGQDWEKIQHIPYISINWKRT